MTDTAELSHLGSLALSLAQEGGELAARLRAGTVEVAATKSSLVDVVTAADREVELLIRSRLAELRPEDSILGEEGADVVGTSGLTWVIDPIDGTVNYLYRLPSWSVSVAVCRGRPDPREWDLLAGAVVAPALGRTWHATKGGGAFRDGERIQVGAATELELALIGTGFGYRAAQRAAQAAVVAEILPKVRDIRRLGSCAIDMCLTAEGSLDGYYEQGINPWDMAAGELVVREAGGVVTGLGGQPASINMVVAGNETLAAELGRVVALSSQSGLGGV